MYQVCLEVQETEKISCFFAEWKLAKELKEKLTVETKQASRKIKFSKYLRLSIYIYLYIYLVLLTSLYFEGARGVIVIVVGNEHGDTSSNPGRDWLHFT